MFDRSYHNRQPTGFLESFAYGGRGKPTVSHKLGRIRVWCYCYKCGGFTNVSKSDFTSEKIKSCGCLQRTMASTMNSSNITKQRFGRLVATRPTEERRHGSIVWKCACDCGGATTATAENLLRGHVGSCGCIRGEISGENHPNWNPNLTDADREDRRLKSEYTEWRTNIFTRDNYTCQISGKSSCKLNAHHVRNWADCPELRYDLDNGITMTEKHHNGFHKLFGKRDNTPGQLWLYMLSVEQGVLEENVF